MSELEPDPGLLSPILVEDESISLGIILPDPELSQAVEQELVAVVHIGLGVLRDALEFLGDALSLTGSPWEDPLCLYDDRAGDWFRWNVGSEEPAKELLGCFDGRLLVVDHERLSTLPLGDAFALLLGGGSRRNTVEMNIENAHTFIPSLIALSPLLVR